MSFGIFSSLQAFAVLCTYMIAKMSGEKLAIGGMIV